MQFDYRDATESAILARAKELEGRLIGTILGARLVAATGATGRSEVGLAVERHFGIPQNSSPLPDFPGAGIELKVVPTLRRGQQLVIKERTVLSSIDYETLVEETWATASVRKKMRILFVFFEHLRDRPKHEFPILLTHLWEPDERTEAFIRADWERVRTKVRHGRAHELSESDGSMMGPCTKAATGASRRRQPFSTVPAKPRAWALKPSLTLSIYRAVTSIGPAVSLAQTLEATGSHFESRLIQRFKPFVGATVDDAASRLGMQPSHSKSYAAMVARRVFGGRDFRTKILEFGEMGLTPRSPRVGPDWMPYESVSFPAFDYYEVIDETWEDSALLAHVEYMLFIPVIGRDRGTAQGDCAFARPVFWRPTTQQIELIRREWEMFRIEIGRGAAASVTRASETLAIHVRPHGRNAADTRSAPGAGDVVKKSFWLNKPFVRDILRAAALNS